MREEKTAFLVQASFKGLEKGKKRPPAKAYLLSSSGELLDSQPIDEKGRATLRTDHGFGKRGRFRVMVGPETKQINRLREFRARTKIVHADIGSEVEVPPFEVFEPEWACWWGVLYNIVGEVKKKLVLDADTTVYAPICDAEIEIYEVDYRHCIATLPDITIERIREAVLERIYPWPPEPWPPRLVPEPKVWPPPPPPPPIGPQAAPPGPSFSAEASEQPPVSEARPHRLSAASAASALPVTEIRSTSTAGFRALLLNKAVLFKSLVCAIFPHLFCYSLTSLATVTPDAHGRFATMIGFMCPSDEPDLYFVVRQTIGGTLRNVYSPRPIPCYTYWNYESGTEVSLIVTDPDAYACYDPAPTDKPGAYVMPSGIGWDGWYDIHQAHIKPPLPTILDPNRGLYEASDPYGRRLDIQMQFHDALQALGVAYYRWSYQKEGASSWTHIDTPISHRHLTSTPAGKRVIVAEELGPNKHGDESGLFLVPDPNLDWVTISRNDQAFAIWHTSGLEDGKYKLQLEMFDSAGDKITDPAAAGFKYFLPTGPVSAGEWPVDDALHVETDGSIILRLHVDNADTVAEIESVGLGATPPGECQFLEYATLADEITVKYQAYHPNGFLAEYDLKILRGQSGTRKSPDEWVNVTDPAGPPTTTPLGEGLPPATAESLLAGYPQCAFSAELHTYPRTRNGYSRIRAYEDHDTSAFALVAETP